MTDHQQQPAVPQASRPHPLAGYGVPESEEGLLAWDYVADRLAQSRNYWIATVHPAGRPHVVPVWGVWLDGTLYFGGGPHTRWSRNLERNPAVSVHLEDGSEAVIIEGTVTRITDGDDPRFVSIDDAYEAKYDIRHGPPVWILHPRKVFAWTSYPKTVTRWVFADRS